jgi:hypothetical protein
MNGMPQPPRQHLPWSRFGRSRQAFTRDYPFGAARRGRSPAEKPSPPYSQGREARSEGWEQICLHAVRSLCTY